MIILAVVLAEFGIETLSVPSLAVASAITVKVPPPSVDNKISTLLQCASVPFTVHVIVDAILPVKVSPPFGAVTANGPVLATVIFIKSFVTRPKVGLLSLTAKEKFKSLAAQGNFSQSIVLLFPAKTSVY